MQKLCANALNFETAHAKHDKDEQLFIVNLKGKIEEWRKCKNKNCYNNDESNMYVSDRSEIWNKTLAELQSVTKPEHCWIFLLFH